MDNHRIVYSTVTRTHEIGAPPIRPCSSAFAVSQLNPIGRRHVDLHAHAALLAVLGARLHLRPPMRQAMIIAQSINGAHNHWSTMRDRGSMTTIIYETRAQLCQSRSHSHADTINVSILWAAPAIHTGACSCQPTMSARLVSMFLSIDSGRRTCRSRLASRTPGTLTRRWCDQCANTPSSIWMTRACANCKIKVKRD